MSMMFHVNLASFNQNVPVTMMICESQVSLSLCSHAPPGTLVAAARRITA